jgi:DNA-binding transcriptional LysR family regulator
MLDRRLNHVIAIAHCGSFTKAAERTGISQSGITKSIADLERELGYALFFRTARGAMPTEEGREFVERAIRLLDDATALLAGKREKDDPFAQALRIGICPASVEWLLAKPLAELLRRHPTIRFELVASTFERVIQLLRTGSMDVAFGFEEAFADWGEVKRERISSMQSVFFVRKDHPILCGSTVNDALLAQHDFVVPSDSRPYGAIIRALFDDTGQWQRHLHVIDYFPTVRRIVATSDAIGVTTREYSRSEEFSEKFECVPGASPLPRMGMCCAIRSRWEPTPAVRAFLRVMRESMPAEI